MQSHGAIMGRHVARLKYSLLRMRLIMGTPPCIWLVLCGREIGATDRGRSRRLPWRKTHNANGAGFNAGNRAWRPGLGGHQQVTTHARMAVMHWFMVAVHCLIMQLLHRRPAWGHQAGIEASHRQVRVKEKKVNDYFPFFWNLKIVRNQRKIYSSAKLCRVFFTSNEVKTI